MSNRIFDEDITEEQVKNARAWIEALRSGDYAQGKSYLRTTEGYCCLGVACDLAVKFGLANGEWQDMNADLNVYVFTYEDHWLGFSVPPVQLMSNVFGASGHNLSMNNMGLLEDPYEKVTLDYLNDHVATFDQIADFIETHLELTLFGKQMASNA